ncbi:hypothetical protein C8R47DRAFT_1063264 [Mycena vitilis]|nr:hypothetical protein C8R47DRAFT_1063264 [Mycena vitilis]
MDKELLKSRRRERGVPEMPDLVPVRTLFEPCSNTGPNLNTIAVRGSGFREIALNFLNRTEPCEHYSVSPRSAQQEVVRQSQPGLHVGRYPEHSCYSTKPDTCTPDDG